MKTVIAGIVAALLASPAATAEPSWEVHPSYAERNTNGTFCRVWVEQGEQGWYGHVYATTSRYRLAVMLTDGSDGRDRINGVNLGPIQPSHRFELPDPFYGVADGSRGRIVREVLANACPLDGLLGPAAAVLRIAHGY